MRLQGHALAQQAGNSPHFRNTVIIGPLGLLHRFKMELKRLVQNERPSVGQFAPHRRSPDKTPSCGTCAGICQRARYRSKIIPSAEMLSLTLMKVLLMTCFYALVRKDADSSFGVTFPDLPGCYSAADRIEDLLPNAAEALELWFEDQEDVTPSLLYEVQRFVAEELASGAFIVAVPRVARLPEKR